MTTLRYAVIMAGGSGERFWPLSRKHRPKQLLRLTSPTETLLEEAVNRIAPLVGLDRVIIATAPHLAEPIREANLVPDENVLAEPDKRNTLGCLTWIAGKLAARHPGEEISMAVLTADHKIENPDDFRSTVARALDIAEQEESLVTIGVLPTRPETGYGYIEFDSAAPVGTGSKVKSFREKPDLPTATGFVSDGSFLWNSGMFFWTLSTFHRELAGANSELAGVARSLTDALSIGDDSAAVDVFRQLPNLSIDYALMERASRVAVLAAEFPWDDVGAWDALERTMPVDERGNVVQGETVLVDVTDSIIYNESPTQTVSLVGIHDLVVIVTPDSVLICPKSEAQRVKEIVGILPDHVK